MYTYLYAIRFQDGPTDRLSGGWRMRLALAKALFVAPDMHRSMHIYIHIYIYVCG